MKRRANTTHFPEVILTNIQSRLPFRSISRFKSVCKTWKSTIESVYFRRLFLSNHQNSSWSLTTPEAKELIASNGCETWNLPKSLALLTRNSARPQILLMSSSNGLVLIGGIGYGYYVGNPVLQQWVKIPFHPHLQYASMLLSLVTRVDEDGVVLAFKVVGLGAVGITCLRLYVYPSATGIWSTKRLHFKTKGLTNYTISLNETIYFISNSIGVISHDLFSESDQCSVTPLPDKNQEYFMRSVLTISKGYVMYITTSVQSRDNMLNVWRLINGEGERWQVLYGIRLPVISHGFGLYAPMAMHPFDSDIVYLWNRSKTDYLVSINLRTKDHKVLGDASKHSFDDQDCFVDYCACVEYIDETWGSRSARENRKLVTLSPFVFPPWMESVPRPPQAEMIYTNTTIPSYSA